MDEHTSHELAYKKGYEKGGQDTLRWIPVAERLPDMEPGTWKDEDGSEGSYEISDWVLGIDTEGRWRKVRYETGPVFQGWYEKTGTVCKITHWMQTPKGDPHDT